MPDRAGKVVQIESRYEAGYPSDYNASPPRANSADTEVFAAGDKLRDWARYLAKNSSIIKATLDARVAKGIGTGLRYEPMVKDRRGNLLNGLNDQIRRIHENWSTAADVTGELARQELERLAWRDWDTVGELFGRKVYRGRTAQRMGYQVQTIRSELVPYGVYQQGVPAMGIERDEWGAPLQYWVLPYLDTSQFWQLRVPNLQPRGIPAAEIKHLRRQEELDQTRGVTLFHAVIYRASDIAEYQQSHRRAARASANLFASINREMDVTPSGQADPESYNTTTDRNELNLVDLQLIDWLGAGESLNFHNPSHPNQNAPDFVNQELRQFASACRVAFSWIAYVFDRAYAAQRTELVHAWEMIYEDRAQFVRDLAKPLFYDEPLRVAIAENRLPARELRRADPSTLMDVRIEGPVMPSIDPVSDRNAAQIDQEQGWESRFGNIRRFGRDPKHVDAERQMDLEFNRMTENEAGQDDDE